MKYRFINEHRSQHAISLTCRLRRVTRAGFYAWLHDPVSTHEQEGRRLLELISYSHNAWHGIYGARPEFSNFREVGEVCGRRGVGRIMQEHRIKDIRG